MEVYEYSTRAEARSRTGRNPLASSGSIPTKEAPKPHVTVPVWCVRRCAMKGSNRSSRQHFFWKLYESYSLLHVMKTFYESRTLSSSPLQTSRAHFYADAVRDVYVRLPDEDPKAKPGVCGKLRKTMYWIFGRSPTMWRALRSSFGDWRIFPRRGISVPFLPQGPGNVHSGAR